MIQSLQNLKYLFIPLKRIYFLFLFVFKNLLRGINWLFSSKEHTNFSYKLNNPQIRTVSYIVSRFYGINEDLIIEDISYLQSLKIENKFKDFLKTIDLDFSPKWDYRIIPYTLVKNKKINSIFEFGIDQGRIGYLLNDIKSKDDSFDFKYTGVEKNPRKGILLKDSKFKNIKIIFSNLEEHLLEIPSDNLKDSLIISSTHEINSEKFLFEYLNSNKIFPKYLISDECSRDSEYAKFVENNNYTNAVIPFEDPNKFLNTIYVGISKLN